MKSDLKKDTRLPDGEKETDVQLSSKPNEEED